MRVIEWKCDKCGEENRTNVEDEFLMEWSVAINPGKSSEGAVVECNRCGELRKVS